MKHTLKLEFKTKLGNFEHTYTKHDREDNSPYSAHEILEILLEERKYTDANIKLNTIKLNGESLLNIAKNDWLARVILQRVQQANYRYTRDYALKGAQNDK